MNILQMNYIVTGNEQFITVTYIIFLQGYQKRLKM